MRYLLSTMVVLSVAWSACGDEGAGDNSNNDNGVCALSADDIATGDPDGHPEPLGAGAAGQARAARISDPAWIAQPEDTRQRVRLGDFLLINSRIAVYIEDGGVSDGYAMFGGEILGIDKVGPDGAPLGVSRYGEALMGLAAEMIRPESVTVLNDGSDGEAAVVRVKGTYEAIPILADFIGSALGVEIGMPGYYDFVLEPDSPQLQVRLGIINTTADNMDLDELELYGFFHYSRSQMATERRGFDRPGGGADWVAFVSGDWNFAWRSPQAPISFGIVQSGLALFIGGGLDVPPCTLLERDHAEIIAGGPHYDGLREAIRAVDGEPAWRAIEGVVEDSGGAPMADVWVHELDGDGRYLSRTRTDAAGAFTIHAPDEAVTLVPQLRGYPTHLGTTVDAQTSQATLTFGRTGQLHVTAVDASTLAPIPVRVQVLPTVPEPATPDAYGVLDEKRGRLHQYFAHTGEATLTVPPGEHRVIVSRGYEYELLDTTVQVGPDAAVNVDATLIRSVDTTGYLCADFHVHTYFSADSNDPVDHKIRGQVADGLDLPVFSDHEWVTAPQPLVVELGLEALARGITSLELTTFSWGHFGIVPIEARPDELNNGAIDWVSHTPAEAFAMVRALPEQPLIIVNHPRNSTLGGYFNAADFDRDTGQGNELWSDDFDVIEAFNGSDYNNNRTESVADWYAFLDQGRDMVVVGSSDNHHLRDGPTGYPRSCLYFGHDDPSMVEPSLLRQVLHSGNAFVSGGLYLDVLGPAGERMGETISTGDATVTLRVTVQAASWIPAETLEVIVNGESVQTLDLIPTANPGPGQLFVHDVVIPVDSALPRTWVVFHTRADGDLGPLHDGKRPFGVTNAIYIVPQ